MEEDMKKITFISLAQALFKNELKGINSENCISFYHYLLDGLEEKSQKLLQDDDENFLVYDAVVHIMEKFPEIDQQELADLMKYENYIIEYLQERTMMDRVDIVKSLEKLRLDASYRMTLFLGAP